MAEQQGERAYTADERPSPTSSIACLVAVRAPAGILATIVGRNHEKDHRPACRRSVPHGRLSGDGPERTRPDLPAVARPGLRSLASRVALDPQVELSGAGRGGDRSSRREPAPRRTWVLRFMLLRVVSVLPWSEVLRPSGAALQIKLVNEYTVPGLMWG